MTLDKAEGPAPGRLLPQWGVGAGAEDSAGERALSRRTHQVPLQVGAVCQDISLLNEGVPTCQTLAALSDPMPWLIS